MAAKSLLESDIVRTAREALSEKKKVNSVNLEKCIAGFCWVKNSPTRNLSSSHRTTKQGVRHCLEEGHVGR
jgi:hypothetical protein